jgi:hypothetical protein
MGKKMRSKSRTEDKVLSDPFTSFKKATRQAFAFLRAPAYKFNEVQTVCHPPECIVRYENKTTGVIISYEWGGTPSVIVSRLHPDLPVEEEQFGLKFLVMERCPEELDRIEAKGSSDDIAQVLTEYAQILKKCGHEVLTGDFQVLPRLNKLIIAERRKTNLEMFGSETGETPKR